VPRSLSQKEKETIQINFQLTIKKLTLMSQIMIYVAFDC